jgi:hypothetical protein
VDGTCEHPPCAYAGNSSLSSQGLLFVYISMTWLYYIRKSLRKCEVGNMSGSTANAARGAQMPATPKKEGLLGKLIATFDIRGDFGENRG